MIDVGKFGVYITSGVRGSSRSRFHNDAGCFRLDGADHITHRDESYIRWHGLKPCDDCHDVCTACSNPLPSGYVCDGCEP